MKTDPTLNPTPTRGGAIPRWSRFALLAIAAALLFLVVDGARSQTGPSWWWRIEWQRTEFAKASVDFSEIVSGGVKKDDIPSIDDPVFTGAR